MVARLHVFGNNQRIHFIIHNIFGLIHVRVLIYIVNDPLDLLRPHLHLLVQLLFLTFLVCLVLNNPVRSSFHMRTTILGIDLFPARALLAVRTVGATPVEKRNHVLHPLTLHEILLLQRKSVIVINVLQQVIQLIVLYSQLRGLVANVIFECTKIRIDALIYSTIHTTITCYWGVVCGLWLGCGLFHLIYLESS